jgi:hypothetical protein
LLEKLKDPILAGIITHDLLDKYKTASTVRGYLPKESKDRVQQAKAEISNEKQAHTRRIKKQLDKEDKEEAITKKLEEQTERVRVAMKKGLVAQIKVNIPPNKYLRKDIARLMLTTEECMCDAQLIGTTAIITSIDIEEQDPGEPIATPTRPH